ncbi:MAG: DUF4422 domain-containing protein [Bifidobacterium aquikefiri]|uniref:Glycosyl transferase n=1 Tax=Bifidobacterium aquikefiri TaxID=1653207 RepID=A0A261G305_9BIFI|nr:DUF4422 domain-containing protein [Bifidobacterium aquikefiri]OZG65605.1 glycosyl transferase [Bifidobacterium aquikefiri]
MTRQELLVPASIIIAVAAHKQYRMPDDSIYLPIHVGAAIHSDVLQGMTGDNTGINISKRNNSYSELTALYWIWKNTSSEYKGLVHYRRHFGTRSAVRFITQDRFKRIILSKELQEILKENDVIVAKKRNYYIETVSSHYSHTFTPKHLEVARKILVENYAPFVPAFDKVMMSRSAHMFNMFIMKNNIFDNYCTFLFPFLRRLETELGYANLDAFQSRYPGRVSEMLLDVWLITTKLKFTELPVINTEPVDWPKKGASFLMAKFKKKGYTKSF